MRQQTLFYIYIFCSTFKYSSLNICSSQPKNKSANFSLWKWENICSFIFTEWRHPRGYSQINKVYDTNTNKKQPTKLLWLQQDKIRKRNTKKHFNKSMEANNNTIKTGIDKQAQQTLGTITINAAGSSSRQTRCMSSVNASCFSYLFEINISSLDYSFLSLCWTSMTHC